MWSAGKGRLQLLFGCNTRDKTGALGLGEQRERRRSAGSLLGFLDKIYTFNGHH